MVLVGLLMGFCACTKYTAIVPILSVMVALIFTRAGFRGTATVLLIAALLLAPWIARNCILHGNPIAPFFPSMIPTIGWDESRMSQYLEENYSFYVGGLSKVGAVSGTFSFPWNMSIRNVGDAQWYGGPGGWFIWLLPIAWLFGFPGFSFFAATLIGYAVPAYFLMKSARYWLPIWPACAIACAFTISAVVRSKICNPMLVKTIVAVLMVMNLLGMIQRQFVLVNPLPVVTGRETRDAYLARRLHVSPRFVAHSTCCNMAARSKALVVSEYDKGSLWGGRLITQCIFDTPVIEAISKQALDWQDIGKKMRQLGIGYLLYSRYGGYISSADYGLYVFDRESARRWSDYWKRSAREVCNIEDTYILYSLVGNKGVPSGGDVVSDLPGVDEQWLGPLEEQRQLASAGKADIGLAAVASGLQESIARRESPPGYEFLGETLVALGDYAGAITAFHNALRLGRDVARVHAGLGVSMVRLGNIQGGRRQLQEALRRDSGLEYARRELAVIGE
jgi:hypothetical protein